MLGILSYATMSARPASSLHRIEGVSKAYVYFESVNWLIWLGIRILKLRLDYLYHRARSCEFEFLIFTHKHLSHQNHSTDWEASVVHLNFFKRLLDFSQQHFRFCSLCSNTSRGIEDERVKSSWHSQKCCRCSEFCLKSRSWTGFTFRFSFYNTVQSRLGYSTMSRFSKYGLNDNHHFFCPFFWSILDLRYVKL